MDLPGAIATLVSSLITPEVVYFPVRHHSPACAWAIRRWIRENQPRAVLVEGPDDFQPLLPQLLHAKCVPPVAIYTYVQSRGKSARGDEPRHAAYYPLAAYSPEWVALREGHAAGAELRFIDLDFASQQRVEDDAARKPGALRIESLQMEQYFRRSAWLREVARRCGCRNHDELWDHLIEVRDPHRPVNEVVREVAAYCYISRFDAPPETLAADGTLAREAVMAAAIREVLAKGGKRPVLVVTGGFHSVVLPGLVAAQPEPPPPRLAAAVRHACLTRYSFPQLDALAGYAAGMPQPGYYQSLWEALEAGEAGPLDAVALRSLVNLGQAARARDLSASVSVADEIAALEQARRLAQLRGHTGPSREDLWDAIRSCLVKGELGADGEAVLALARKLLTGEATGEVPPNAGVPPLVDDFRQSAQAMKLPITYGGNLALALEIYKKPAHRQTSRLLHRLGFLGVPYANRRAGPDFLAGVDLRRVIEHWDCQWIPQTESKLIEMSAYGASVSEAAAARLREEAARLDEEAADCASAGVGLLIRCCLMGLPETAAELTEQLAGWIGRDASFVSVAGAVSRLVVLWQSREPLDAGRLTLLPELIPTAYQRACQLLGNATQLPDDQAAAFIDGALTLNSRLSMADAAPELDPELFEQSLSRLLDHPTTPPLLRGAATGLLHTANRIEMDEVMRLVAGALSPAVGDGARQVAFLTGLLKTSRELAWREPRLLQAIEDLFGQWSEDEFLLRLPHLRLAWSDLTPRETDRVATCVAANHGVAKDTISRVSRFAENDLMAALAAFARVERALVDDGLETWLEPLP